MTARPARADFVRLPEAVAIIMDGNGRWAEERGQPRFKGHEVGAESVRSITRECARLGIGELTLYAFSTENWKRSEQEVSLLMTLLERYLVEERGEIMDNGIVFRAIGELERLPASVQREYEKTRDMSAGNGGMVLRLALSYGGRREIMDNGIVFRAIGELERLPASVQREYEKTRDMSAGNGGMVLRLALSYGGRRELLHAAQKLAQRAATEGLDAVMGLGEDDLRQFLYDPTMRDPDLMIRTAGEMRISNFLLWQASYAELYVADVSWPDFREEALHTAFRSYGARERRFGGTTSA